MPCTAAGRSASRLALRLSRGLSRCVEQDVEQAAFVVGFVVGEILFYVFDGFGEHVETISELVEFLARDDQLVFSKAQFGSPLAGFVVALAARASAELAGAAGAACRREREATPSAPARRFRQ